MHPGTSTLSRLSTYVCTYAVHTVCTTYVHLGCQFSMAMDTIRLSLRPVSSNASTGLNHRTSRGFRKSVCPRRVRVAATLCICTAHSSCITVPMQSEHLQRRTEYGVPTYTMPWTKADGSEVSESPCALLAVVA